MCDAKLGATIKEKLNIACVHDESVMELMRGLRAQIEELVTAATPAEMRSMAIGLAHSLSRYKLKFSPDKVDTMIVQAIGLLDDLDKELNTYAMRLKEWYGWHFPEMGKIVPDNLMYAKAIMKMGVRTQCKSIDFSDILPEEVEEEMKDAAEISMGTEVSEEDIANILMLCEQVDSPHSQLHIVITDARQANSCSHRGPFMGGPPSPLSTRRSFSMPRPFPHVGR